MCSRQDAKNAEESVSRFVEVIGGPGNPALHERVLHGRVLHGLVLHGRDIHQRLAAKDQA